MIDTLTKVFHCKELKAGNVKGILNKTLEKHSPYLQVTDMVITHDILITQKPKSKGKRKQSTVEKRKERRVA
eukprot:763786-Ditylum_brightwellii.AAC.1